MLNPDDLRNFTPINGLSEEGLTQAVAAMARNVWPEGKVLFRQGEKDGLDLYLLEGEVGLSTGEGTPPLVIRAGSDAARHPLANLKPRRYTGTARTAVVVASINEDLLDDLLARDQTTAYEVTEFEGEDPEWMFHLLRTAAFQRVPTANLAALFSRLEPIVVKAGDVVVRQGESGDYYFLIRQGLARVSRMEGGREAALADLGVGDGFGEEALLSGEPRNATITMLNDGLLMRLSQADFNAILKPPLVKWVDAAGASALVKDGAGLIDVRLEDEFRSGSLRGSVNIPLYMLRLKAKGLDPKRKYVLLCQTERRSTVAAFLLSQRGFDVYVLKDGLHAIKQA